MRPSCAEIPEETKPTIRNKIIAAIQAIGLIYPKFHSVRISLRKNGVNNVANPYVFDKRREVARTRFSLFINKTSFRSLSQIIQKIPFFKSATDISEISNWIKITLTKH